MDQLFDYERCYDALYHLYENEIIDEEELNVHLINLCRKIAEQIRFIQIHEYYKEGIK